MSGTPNPGLWQGDYTFCVVGTAAGMTPEGLMQGYMAAGHAGAPPARMPRSLDGRPITAAEVMGSGPARLPEIITLRNPPSSVPQRQLALLRAASPAVMQRAARLPLLPGETAASSEIGVLGAPWQGIPAGAVVCTRTTNRGTMAFILHGYRVDLVTGEIERSIPPAPAPAPAAMNAVMRLTATTADASSGPTVIQSALTVAQFAGFALGPAGLVLSAGAAILLTIFNQCMSSQQVPLSTIVTDAVREVATEIQLENADATINTDYKWLSDHYNASWEQNAPPTDSDLQQFRQDLETKLDADTGILQVVGLLMEADFQTKGFVLFLFGAGIVLLMYKIALILESTEKRVVDAYQYTALMDALNQYITFADQTIVQIDGLVAQRLGQITEPARENDVRCQPTGACTALPYWGWSDTATTDPANRYYDTDSGDNCHDTKVQHQADAQTARDAYAAQIKAQQMTQYYGGDRDKAVATVQQWKDMQSEFAQFAPPKQ